MYIYLQVSEQWITSLFLYLFIVYFSSLGFVNSANICYLYKSFERNSLTLSNPFYDVTRTNKIAVYGLFVVLVKNISFSEISFKRPHSSSSPPSWDQSVSLRLWNAKWAKNKQFFYTLLNNLGVSAQFILNVHLCLQKKNMIILIFLYSFSCLL